jgi:hypothetical protein
MIKAEDVNLAMVKRVAELLGPLLPKVVFLGGAATGLLITDEAAPEVRATKDVDVIVEILSRSEYYKLEETLRSLGFAQSMEEDAPLCRWLIGDIKVDVMPTDEKILGFSNKWYSPAIKKATEIYLEKGLKARIVTAPYFLATKIEAFYGRGKGDYIASHDMEDIIAIIDGRIELIDEVNYSDANLKKFLSKRFQRFLKIEAFLESLPGHLRPDPVSQARLPKITSRIEKIAALADLVY